MLKKIAALLFMFGSAVAFAQNLSVVPVTVIPTTCYPVPLYEYQAGSTVYVSGPGNTCVALGTGGGGGDTITSPNSTLSVGGTATATTLDINLAHANTWTGNQTSAKWIASTGFDISGATTAGHYLRNNGTDYVDSAIQAADVPGYVANVTFTVSSSTTINANSCSPASGSAGTSVTMTGLTSTMALAVTPNADITNTTGWGNPAAGVLYITVAPGSGSFTYHVCNNTAANITTGGSATFNVHGG